MSCRGQISLRLALSRDMYGPRPPPALSVGCLPVPAVQAGRPTIRPADNFLARREIKREKETRRTVVVATPTHVGNDQHHTELLLRLRISMIN